MTRSTLAREKTRTVYTVIIDTDGEGPAGDGTVIRRFRSRSEAEICAAASTCYGRAAKVQVEDVPLRLARRWGVA